MGISLAYQTPIGLKHFLLAFALTLKGMNEKDVDSTAEANLEIRVRQSSLENLACPESMILSERSKCDIGEKTDVCLIERNNPGCCHACVKAMTASVCMSETRRWKSVVNWSIRTGISCWNAC